MNLKFILGTVITTIITLLLVVSVVIPVVTDSSTTNETGQNEIGFMGRMEASDTFVVSDDGETPFLNNVALESATQNEAKAILADKLIAITYGGNWTYFTNFEGTYARYNSSDDHRATLEVENKNATFTYGGTEVWSGELEYSYIPNEMGRFVQSSATATPIIDPDSTMMIFGIMSSSNGTALGSINEGFVEGFHSTNSVADSWEPSITSEVVKVGKTDLEKITEASGFVLIPYEYAYLENKEGAEYSLITIIPLLMVIGIVLGVIGSVIRNRD